GVGGCPGGPGRRARAPGPPPRPWPSGDGNRPHGTGHHPGGRATRASAMDLIAFGTVFLEIVFGDVPSLSAPGEEVFADDFAIPCGGGAVPAASAARRSGASAGMSTLLGEDLGSRVAEEY